MKKLIIVPTCILFLSVGMPRNVEVEKPVYSTHITAPSSTVKIDSINIKAAELKSLIQKL